MSTGSELATGSTCGNGVTDAQEVCFSTTFVECTESFYDIGSGSLVISDFNQDSFPDVFVGDGFGSYGSLVLSTGANAWSFVRVAVADHAEVVAAADVIGDAAEEIVVGQGYPDDRVTLLKYDAGSLAVHDTFALGGSAKAIRFVEQLSGRADLVVLVETSIGSAGTLQVRADPGAGAYSAATPVDRSVCIFPKEIAVGDLNGDSAPDLVVVCDLSALSAGSENVYIYMNDGSGDYAASPIKIGISGASPHYATIGDLDSDATSEIVIVGRFSKKVNVVRQLPDGGYQPQSAALELPQFPIIGTFAGTTGPNQQIALYEGTPSLDGGAPPPKLTIVNDGLTPVASFALPVEMGGMAGRDINADSLVDLVLAGDTLAEGLWLLRSHK